MTWNHRVFYDHNDDPDLASYRFVEVYYESENKPEAYGEPFMSSDTKEGLQVLINRLQKALAEPQLTSADFKEKETI
jgi:hypothetical protein